MGQARESTANVICGRYETLFRIASGGMAEVYAARVRGEAGFQKLVALKRMLPHLTDDEHFVTMFLDEGRLAANIESPNVVSTMDLGRADDGSLYLVMELVVGTTLYGLLRNAARGGDSIPIDVGCEMLAQAAQGLHDAHEARTPVGEPLQLIHRDVSPRNILVGTDGRVRITDFGVARAVLRRTKTSTGEFKGKLSYFSPEQCADRGIDRRSDVFSLGVVAWETLTTRRLFHAKNPLLVLERVTRMEIPLAHTVRTDVPPAVSAVVARALERDREARYSTALDFAVALRKAAAESVGTSDRSHISDLVQEHGGESLERMQAQIKESLAEPLLFGHWDELDDPTVIEFDDPTEISSGFAAFGDEPVGPTTPKADTGSLPHFEDAPETRPSKGGQAPLVVAVAVALLGLTGGAVIALLGSGAEETEGDREATFPNRIAAPEEPSEPRPAEQREAEPGVIGVEDTEPETDMTTTPVANPRPRRGRRLAGRHDADPIPTTPEPPPVPDPDPDPDDTPATEPEPEARQPVPPPPAGFLGWDEG